MKQKLGLSIVDRLAKMLLALFILDRILKMAAVIHFFRRKPPAPPPSWPMVTLLQPVTRGVSGLRNNLRSRVTLDYPGEIQHLLICDKDDRAMQQECELLLAEHPQLQARIVLASPSNGAIASKIEKLLAALPYATGDIYCFLDDDIALRPHALKIMLSYLLQPGAGAVFGLACYTNWRTIWSSLMSVFVNAHALLSYIPITYLTEPFTITGHCFALRRSTFEQVGGFADMQQRIDDDHEMARRVRKAGLQIIQTPMIYDVDNHFGSFQAYWKQMKRWFIFPRQAMIPYMTPAEQGLSLLASLSQLVPALLALLALLTLRRSALLALVASLGVFGTIYALCELCYLQRTTPLKRWPLVPLMGLAGPLQVLWMLLTREEIEWRGQRLRIHIGGKMEIVS